MRRSGGVLVLVMLLAIPAVRLLACVEEIEPNNSIGYADHIGSVPGQACGVGAIRAAGDFDVWAFEITVPALVRIETIENWYDGDTLIGLYDEEGRLIDQDDDSGVGKFSLIDYESQQRVLDPGYYYVVVQDYDGTFVSNEQYEVRVSGRPYSKPETPPADDWGCDMARYDRAMLSGGFHFNSNLSSDGYYPFAVYNDDEHPLRWSGSTFSVSFEERYRVDRSDSFQETVTIISIQGTVSSDCRTLLTATFKKEEKVYEGYELDSVSTHEMTVVNLPLDQAGVQVPRCTLLGQEIASRTASITYQWECAWSPSDSYRFESFSLHPDDRLRFELRQ